MKIIEFYAYFIYENYENYQQKNYYKRKDTCI